MLIATLVPSSRNVEIDRQQRNQIWGPAWQDANDNANRKFAPFFCHGPVIHTKVGRGCAMSGPTACLDANHALPVPHDFVTHCTLGGPETKKSCGSKSSCGSSYFQVQTCNCQHALETTLLFLGQCSKTQNGFRKVRRGKRFLSETRKRADLG